jgi:hypothetical protein
MLKKRLEECRNYNHDHVLKNSWLENPRDSVMNLFSEILGP